MKVVVDFSVVPIGVGVSLSKYVVECEKVLRRAGLETRLHAYGTNVEGEWDEVFAAIRLCHETLHGVGVPRISTVIKVGTRSDRDPSIEAKIRSVDEALG